jgi:hypothetical protein
MEIRIALPKGRLGMKAYGILKIMVTNVLNLKETVEN